MSLGNATPRVAAVLGLAAVLSMAPAGTGSAAATTCQFSSGTVTVRVSAGTAVRMFVWPETRRIWWGNQSDSSQEGYCGRARTSNTDVVRVIGHGRSAKLDYQQPYLPFGDGTLHNRGEREVEFILRDMTGFWLTGLGGAKGVGEQVRLGESGVDVNGDGDRDVTFREGPMTNVSLFLLGGPDTGNAGGGSGTGQPWPRARHLVITGGDGDDVLRGHDGADTLMGDPGTDQLFGLRGPDELSDTGIDDQMWGGPGADVLSSRAVTPRGSTAERATTCSTRWTTSPTT